MHEKVHQNGTKCNKNALKTHFFAQKCQKSLIKVTKLQKYVKQ